MTILLEILWRENLKNRYYKKPLTFEDKLKKYLKESGELQKNIEMHDNEKLNKLHKSRKRKKDGGVKMEDDF